MKLRHPLQDGWVCPNCGQTGTRHGRGGARACKASAAPICPGLVCECEDGKCFSRYCGGWHRSPCLHARCAHCGWTGSVRSKDFERAYGHSRCPKSATGWHSTRVRLDRGQSRKADVLVLVFECQLCGAKGFLMVDPVQSVEWSPLERKAPSEG